MAVYKTDLETGEIIKLSTSQIKSEIQAATGWTTAQYQKEYDKLRNKLRNYEATIGAKTAGKVNEELYKIITAERTTGLTERQKAIKGFTSATTAQFREKAEKGQISERQQDAAIDSLVDGTFRALLSKSETTRQAFQEWKKEQIENKVTVTAKAVNKFLGGQAKDLHRRQKDEYEANKEMYDEEDSYPGSD